MAGQRHGRILLVAIALLVAGCTGVVPTDTPAGDAPSSPSLSTPTADATATAMNGSVEVHFINVGQSVSTLIVGPTGETMLVDTGHFNDDGEHVLQYLRGHDIDRIDHLVTSHNDADHIGGNAAVIDYFEREADGVGAIYDPGIAASTQTYEQYLDAVEEYDVALYETRAGDSVQFEGVDVQVLGPPDPYIENEGRNENSLVLKLTYGETSFLFTGDAEDDQEAYLVENYGDQLQSTVMKAGHHGSASSSSGDLLDAVQPKAVILSSAYDSQYGHPAEEVLRRLADRSLPAYWTATHGDIVLVSDGKSVSVRTQQDAPTAPLDIRSGSPVEPGVSGSVTERTRLGGEPVATQTTVVVTDGGTPVQGGELTLAEVNADAEGDDREHLNDEYLVFENTASDSLDLSGWTVEDEAGKTYTFPDDYTLEAGATVTLHTGSGTVSESDLYWGAGSPVWNNAGDTVIVRNSKGERVLMETYS
ncbi:lamin tail domain-containing protein [Halosimplex rubrum]|uniref:Lamin tail domain-containing protein n=1 Tax=Halosimplex rubrum TaxID=869889 RepID=A0A7D5NZF2_9EURY|nr:lamin tail domain-containing protein [Halosimplex rubrum]QLH77243.1 lamin tail domain-containing protein [Halosimplex rubrum]